MNKKIFLFFLFFTLSLNAVNQKMWDFQYSFNLKKDKIATLFIGKNKKTAGKYILKFRWTLYDADRNLILLTSYMGYINQYVLKTKRHLDRVRIKLLSDGRDYNGRTYALIVFSGFDKKKRVATLNVYIKDEMNRIKVEFKPPK